MDPRKIIEDAVSDTAEIVTEVGNKLLDLLDLLLPFVAIVAVIGVLAWLATL